MSRQDIAYRGKRIAVIGASYLQLPLVQRANALGMQTFCFAYEDGAVCRDHCTEFFPISVLERDKILEECQRLKVDGVTSIASDIVVPTISYVAAKMGLFGNSEDSARVSTHKLAMKQRLRSHGVPVAPFTQISRGGELALHGLRFPIVVKPVDRSGSAGVRLVSAPSELEEALEEALAVSFAGEVVAEEFVVAREMSIEAISFQGKHTVLAHTDKVTTGAPSFVETEHHQPSLEPNEMLERIDALVVQALDCLGVEYGASHTEVMITPNDDILITEVGARMGGDFIGSHLVELSTGYDYLAAVLAISLGGKPDCKVTQHRHSGVVFLSPQQPSFDALGVTPEEVIEKQVSSGSHSTLTRSSDRQGYLIYQSDRRICFV